MAGDPTRRLTTYSVVGVVSMSDELPIERSECYERSGPFVGMSVGVTGPSNCDASALRVTARLSMRRALVFVDA
jgi:hypothetical protein